MPLSAPRRQLGKGAGDAAVDAQLRTIEENVRLFAAAAVVEQHRVLSA